MRGAAAKFLTGAAILSLAMVGAAAAQPDPAQRSAEDLTRSLNQTPVQPAPQAPTAPVRDPVADILRQVEGSATATSSAETVPAEVVEEAPPPEFSEAVTQAIPGAPGPREDGPPPARQRRPVAIVQALDKVTTQTMRFEVQVGGPPVMFRNALIFTARACEVSAPGDPHEESAAYLEIRSQPRSTTQTTQARQLFRGWMFASSPALNPLEHPIYDAWVVGCRA